MTDQQIYNRTTGTDHHENRRQDDPPSNMTQIYIVLALMVTALLIIAKCIAIVAGA